MIEKLEIKKVPVPNNPTLAKNVGMDNESLFDKINELCDVVNELNEEAKSNAITRAEHERQIEEFQAKDEEIAEWIAIVGDLRKQVRELQADVSILEEHAHPTAKTPADPYAEQRKWVGKLCWFWDNQEEYKFVGILGEISDNGTYFQKGGIVSYLNCEPVKPDDEIIYKGE